MGLGLGMGALIVAITSTQCQVRPGKPKSDPAVCVATLQITARCASYEAWPKSSGLECVTGCGLLPYQGGTAITNG